MYARRSNSLTQNIHGRPHIVTVVQSSSKLLCTLALQADYNKARRPNLQVESSEPVTNCCPVCRNFTELMSLSWPLTFSPNSIAGIAWRTSHTRATVSQDPDTNKFGLSGDMSIQTQTGKQAVDCAYCEWSGVLFPLRSLLFCWRRGPSLQSTHDSNLQTSEHTEQRTYRCSSRHSGARTVSLAVACVPSPTRCRTRRHCWKQCPSRRGIGSTRRTHRARAAQCLAPRSVPVRF